MRNPRLETKNLYPRYMRRGIPADLRGPVRRGGPGTRNFRKQLLYFLYLRHDVTTTYDHQDR